VATYQSIARGFNLAISQTRRLDLRRASNAAIEIARRFGILWLQIHGELSGVSGREFIILNDEKETLSRSERIENTWQSGLSGPQEEWLSTPTFPGPRFILIVKRGNIIAQSHHPTGTLSQALCYSVESCW
jgi:hypothetical protein